MNDPDWSILALAFAGLAMLGVIDLAQTKHAIRRNYPILGNLRFLFEFVRPELRQLSGGKPVGFKLCVDHPWEWFAIVKAMLKTGITPDFIVVDGAEGGTGAAYKPRRATPTNAPPASRRRIRCGNVRSWCRTKRSGSTSSTATPSAPSASWCRQRAWTIRPN